MTSHTPGPWEVWPDPTAETFSIGPLQSHSNLVRVVAELPYDGGTNNENTANVLRIVACVNACEGINPEAVPDLLAALRDMADCLEVEIACGDAFPYTAKLTEARKAIAKAKEGQ